MKKERKEGRYFLESDTTTRTVKIGEKTIVIKNVPVKMSDDELKTITLKMLFEIEKQKAIKAISGLGVAS